MFEKVNIKNVNHVMNFARKHSVFNGENTIPLLQTQGVTAICKILQNRQYAYLADEVGMGKTYQAVGVISMLLKEKPDAKILIIAPNRSVQVNWGSEIKNFKNNNLNDALKLAVKSFDERKDFLESYREKVDDNIFLTRITMFSTIGDSVFRYQNPNYEYTEEISANQLFSSLCRVTNSKITNGSRVKLNSFDAGKVCGKFLRKYTDFFDLVVVDEAQNIRNENNATVFLNYWLGLKRFRDNSSTNVGRMLTYIPTSKKEDSKFLLLSATPAHRNIDSLRNQLLYFENSSDVPSANKITHEYLSKFLVRRLRTYNDESKYNVRNIVPKDVSLSLQEDNKNGLSQRLFLALVQSKLARTSMDNNKTFKIGFLETFESYNPSENKMDNDEGKEIKKDFENGIYNGDGEKGAAPDKMMLKKLSQSFYDNFGSDKYPPHPKLSFMEEEISKLLKTNIPLNVSAGNAPDKAIVFVRRLATVDELNLRLNKLYEARIVSYWGSVFGINCANLKEVQQYFEKLYNEKTARSEIEDDSEEAFEEDEVTGVSQLQNWLSLKNKHKGKGYFAVSKFKKSLLSNKPNSFLFSENYLKTLYPNYDVNKIVDADFVKEVNEYIAGDSKRYILEYSGKRRYNSSELLPLCCYVALKRLKNDKYADSLKKIYGIKDKMEDQNYGYTGTFIKKLLSQDSLWNHLSEYGVNIDIDNYDFYQREILKGITEKYLKSSEAVLELMYCYIKHSDKTLCGKILERLFSKTCTHGIRIKKLFENRDLVCKQLLGGDSIEDESSVRTKLKFLDLQQWVMSATGGNKGNEGLIKRFNTPFYPDVIVCTDVLKEGINLHLFCNRIYHYGLAWTPGDLEQRIGRVDRFFSKTHRERAEQTDLPDEQKTKIEINYPYLGKSVDEHQLKQVLKFKLSADPLLDTKKFDQKDIQIDLNEISVDELAKSKPEEEDMTHFPYSGECFWKN